jgi:hypothetical protein
LRAAAHNARLPTIFFAQRPNVFVYLRAVLPSIERALFMYLSGRKSCIFRFGNRSGQLFANELNINQFNKNNICSGFDNSRGASTYENAEYFDEIESLDFRVGRILLRRPRSPSRRSKELFEIDRRYARNHRIDQGGDYRCQRDVFLTL